MTSPYSFLIADDHWLVRQGLRQTLVSLGEKVSIHEAASYDEVFDILSDPDSHFDLLLLDLSMPGATPEEAIIRIRQEAPTIPLVTISANDDPLVMRRMIDHGAAGFVPKSSSPSILLSALQLVLAGGIYVPPAALQTHAPSAGIELTERQNQVLGLLAEGAPNKVIAARLGLALPTVKIHVAAVLRRLSARNRTEAVQEALRLGLVHSPRVRDSASLPDPG